MSADLALVKQAIDVILGNLKNPSEVQRANQWLVEFEGSPGAWEAANALLSEAANPTGSISASGSGSGPGSAYRFFGAKILYSKTKRNFHQLGADTVEPYKVALVQHLLRLAAETPVDIRVCRYLCLTLAALVVQLNQPGVVLEVLGWLNPVVATAPRIMLQLLTFIPEESVNDLIVVARETRTQFSDQLSASVPQVFQFLQYLWSSGGSESKLQIIKCFENWTYFTSVGYDVVYAQPLFQEALAQMSANDLLLEGMVDLLTKIIERYGARCVEVPQTLLPLVLSLRPKWQSLAAQEEDDISDDDIFTCQSIARLFAEVAETYIDLIISNEPFFQAEIIQQLIDCASFRHDDAVSKIPLKFFYDLSAILTSRRIRDNVIQYTELTTRFGPVFYRVLDLAIQQLVLPMDVLTSVTPISEELDDKRVDWQDATSDCFQLLDAGACLERLCAVLQQELSHASSGLEIRWNAVEAVFVCVKLVAEKIPADEQLYVPQLLQLVTSLPLEIIGLRVTIVDFLGRLSHWLCTNAAALQLLLPQLVGSLRFERTCIPAARALMRVMEASAGRVDLPLVELHGVMVELRASDSLPQEADVFLLEGMCKIISCTQMEAHASTLAFVMEPIVVTLAAVATHMKAQSQAQGAAVVGGEGATNKDLRQRVARNLDKLTTILQTVRVSEELVLDFFVKLFPVCQQILDVDHSDDTCEKVCRLYKHAIRGSRKAFGPHLPAMAEYVATQFSQLHSAAFMYVASVCVSEFGARNKGAHVETLYAMIWALSTSLFNRFTTIEQFNDAPDVVSEYFYMISKALRACPAPFISSPGTAAVVIRAGITALQIRHADVQKCVLLFFERLLNVESSDFAAALVTGCGADLMMLLFSMLSGQNHLRALSVDSEDGCICDVLWSIRQKYPTYFQVWLEETLLKLPSAVRDIALRLHLPEEVLRQESEKSPFYKVICEFDRSCYQQAT